MDPDWTPVPFNLLTGNPFSYALRSVSAVSATEAFVTGIDLRDKGRCVVCGNGLQVVLEHAHIVPRVEHETVCPLYPLLYVTVLPLKKPDIVGGDAQHRLHSSSGEDRCSRGKEWCADVQKPPYGV